MRKILYLFLFLILFSFLGAENQAGTVLNRAEITSLAATNIFDLISLKTGMIYRSGDEHIYSAPGKRARIGFYLNGMKIDDNVALELNLTKFESIEILTNNIPPKYSDFTDAVILLETRAPDKLINAEVTAMKHSDYLQNYDLALSGVVNKDELKFQYYLDTELSANDTRFKDEFGADPIKELPNLINEFETYNFLDKENPAERDFLMGSFAIDYRENLTFRAAFLKEKQDSHPYSHSWRYAMEYSAVTETENDYLNLELDYRPIEKMNLTASYNGKENSSSLAPNKIGLDDYFTPVYGNAWEMENGFDLYSLDDNNRNYTGIDVLTTSGSLSDLNWTYLSDGEQKSIPGFVQPGSIYNTYYDKTIKDDVFAFDFSYEFTEKSKLSAGYSYSKQVYNYSIVNDPYIVNETRYDDYLSQCNPIGAVMEGDPLVDWRPNSPTYGDTLISAVAEDLNFYSQDDLYAAVQISTMNKSSRDIEQEVRYGYLSYEYNHRYFNIVSSIKQFDYTNALTEAIIFDDSIGEDIIIIDSRKTKANTIKPTIHLEIHPNKIVNLKFGLDTQNIIEPNDGMYIFYDYNYGYIDNFGIISPILTTSDKLYSELSVSYKFISEISIGYQVVDVENAYYSGEFSGYNNNDYIGDYCSTKEKIFNFGFRLGQNWMLSPGYQYTNVKEEISSSRDIQYSDNLYNLRVNFAKIMANPIVENLTMDIEYKVQDGMPYTKLNEEGTPAYPDEDEYMKPTKSLDLKLNYFTETRLGELTAYVAVKNLLDRKNELYVYPKTGSPYYDGEDLSYPGSDYVAADTALIYNSYTANPANISEGMTLQFGLGFRW